jgi:hypothetical protein
MNLPVTYYSQKALSVRLIMVSALGARLFVLKADKPSDHSDLASSDSGNVALVSRSNKTGNSRFAGQY